MVPLPHAQDNPYYVKPKVNNAKFGIRHYAGEVMYDTYGLLDKNRDTFRDDILKVLKESRLVAIQCVCYAYIYIYNYICHTSVIFCLCAEKVEE